MSLEAAILRRLPRPLRRPVRRLLHLPGDLVDGLLGRRPELVPPRGRSFVGAGDFVAVGEELLGHLRTLCGLAPGDRVLDVGCGIGRVAVPLGRYLTTGSYEGFDVVRSDVAWCRRHVGRRFPRFSFRHVDVWNGEYNWNGTIRPEEVTFPYPDGSFDVAFATSVFTHLLPGAFTRYLGEIARVLAPGGRCLVTLFVLNQESRQHIAAGHCGLRFEHRAGEAAVHDPANPEGAVAYEEDFVRRAFTAAGLEMVEPIRDGSWCGRERGSSYQDLVVAIRLGRTPALP